ncbi:hypothetical protein CGZ96_13305 [Enemella evansiae]|uniref:helix-turn-helix domain-containing protein n=1 Tax=Enemella evansiae TaxID=2016499 RepID=UPI000B9639BE|nr:helix-turn-helix domain-containing protein [Enemella evansiae]OYN96239.1 hypothetical protein CGZ96_13305 [Enemella evansiae]
MTADVDSPWAEQMAGAFGLAVGPGAGRVRQAALGEVTAFRMAGTPQVLRRTARAIRGADTTPVKVCAVRSGELVLHREREGEFRIGPGQLVLYDTARPYQLRAEDRWSCTVMTVPRDLLALPARTLAAVLAHRFTEQGPAAVLTQLLDTAVVDGPVRADAAVLLGRATVNLLTGLALEHEAPLAPDDALRAAVLGHIRQHLGDPDLGVAALAAHHGMSVRTLHRLFQDQEWTLAETIRNLRLDAVRADLGDPQLAGRSIMAIAAARGFRDQAHLTRVFKARFGITPAVARRPGHRQE